MIKTLLAIAIAAAIWVVCAIPEPLKTIGWIVIGVLVFCTLLHITPSLA